MHAPQDRNIWGVFEPSQVEEMRAVLRRGDLPGESKASREQRAAAIIPRKMMPGRTVEEASETENPANRSQRGSYMQAGD